MNKKLTWMLIGIIMVSMAWTQAAQAQQGIGPQPVVRAADRFDTSLPLDIVVSQYQAQPDLLRDWSLPRFTLPQGEAASDLFSSAADAALQTEQFDTAMPAPLENFDGIGNVNWVMPPDTQGDIGYDPATGKKYYVQWINLSFQIWDVSDPAAPLSLMGPVNGNALWHGFGGVCETTNDGDPITLFDPIANRWMMSQFALPNFPAGPFYQCIAISTSADPTGSWHRYAFQVHDTKMNDYPKFGVWPDAYYMTVNQFENYSWAGVGVFAFEREKMLAGLPAKMVYFDLYDLNENIRGILPADLDGLNPPPEGSPGLFAGVDDGIVLGPLDSIRLWFFDVDWISPQNSTFGDAVGGDLANADAYLPVTSFTLLPCDRCIPQQGSTVELDSLGDRSMYRLAYRNYGTHQSLLFNHTVKADGVDRAGVRWYELRESGGGWTVYQQGTYAPADGLYRWLGSATMDNSGNIALGYSVSGTTRYPSIAATGRLNGDTLGVMSLGEITLMEGSGFQSGSAARWGDYTMMGIDPQDDCTFWYTNQYMPASSVNGWQTRISAFRYPTCNSGPSGEIRGTIRQSGSGDPLEGATVRVGQYQTVSGADGGYALAVPVGTYDISVSKYGFTPIGEIGVVFQEDDLLTRDYDLVELPTVMMHGTVLDNSGHGWPLYARLTISSSQADLVVYSDPFDGSYQVALYQDEEYQFKGEAVLEGYDIQYFNRTFTTADHTEDILLNADLSTCAAPGYGWGNGLAQHFDYASLPAGWQVVDHAGEGALWTFGNNRENLTGGSGNFAMADSDDAGFLNMDTSLVSPSVNLSAVPSVSLGFKTDYYDYVSTDEFAQVAVSVNQEAWVTVWEKSGSSYPGPVQELIDISALAGGKSDVRVRFRYGGAYFSWYWQVDDVWMGEVPVCNAYSGGIVAGKVTDAKTLSPLNDALIRNEAGIQTTSFSVDGDENNQGLYFLFQATASSPETHTYTASGIQGYPDMVKPLEVTENVVNRLDFPLGSGQLSVAPTEIVVEMDSDAVLQRSLVFQNSGLIPVNVELGLTDANQVNSSSSAAEPHAIVKPFKQTYRTTEKLKLTTPAHFPDLGAVTVLERWQTSLKQAWAAVPVGNQVWVSSPGKGWSGSDAVYQYPISGGTYQERLPYAWEPFYGPADLAWDENHQIMWVMNIHEADQYCIYGINPNSGAIEREICPEQSGFSNAQRGLAYDPLGNTFFAGGWNDGMLYRINSQGEVLDSAWIEQPIAGLAYHTLSQRLYAITNEAVTRLLVFDTANGFTTVGEIDLSMIIQPYGGAGISFDCDGSLWTVDQESGEVIKLDVGENIGACLAADVSWLSLDPTVFSVDAGGEETVTLSFDTSGLSPGWYYARIQVTEDTPYSVDDILVRVLVDGDLLNWIYLPVIFR